MGKCPVCKKRCEPIYNILDQIVGEKCVYEHYECWEENVESGMCIRIGHHIMTNLYDGTVRHCRKQNHIIQRWIQGYKKQQKKKGNKKGVFK